MAHTAPSQSLTPPIPSPIQRQAGLPTPPEPTQCDRPLACIFKGPAVINNNKHAGVGAVAELTDNTGVYYIPYYLLFITYYHDLLSEPADAAAGVLGMPQSALDRAEDPRPPPTTDVAALSAPPAQAISVAELGFDTGVAAAEPPRFCTGCGKGLPAGMAFCTGCGTPACELPSPPAFPAPSPPPRDSSPAVMAGSWPAGADSSDEGEFEEGSDSEIMMMA
jgi:hypothetical protein